ncbi:MAG: hypothetical protein WKF51_11975 [Geodermatophilaceae bacterium]
MHIRISPLDIRPEDAMSELDQQPGLISAYVIRPMDQREPVLVSAWETHADAESATATTGSRDFVSGSFQGSDGGSERPAYAMVVHFEGPRPQAEADAIERANRERIAPVVRAIPGNLGALIGRNPDGSSVVIALTTSLQAIEDSQRAIMSTALLPGEDPAQLGGPTRIQLAWVLAATSRNTPIPV